MTNKSFFETIYVDYQTENYTRRTSSSRNSLIRRHFLPRYGEFEMTATKPEHIENTCASMEEEVLSMAFTVLTDLSRNRGFSFSTPRLIPVSSRPHHDRLNTTS